MQRAADVRVLQLHTRYRQAGGEDAAVAAEAALLREGGHSVDIVEAFNPSGALETAKVFARAPWNGTSAARVAQALHEFQPDVVHVHNTWFAMSPAVITAASRHSPAVVMTLHNYRITCGNSLLFRDGHPCEECVGSHPWHAVQHACYHGSRPRSAVAAATIALNARRRTWLEDVDLFLALTPFARSRFIAAGLPGERIEVVPHRVHDPGSRPAPPSASRDVVFVGRLSPEKGVNVLVAAMSAVADTKLRLVIVGDGPQRRDLERSAGPNVSFTGQLPPHAVRERLLTARALLFPSRWYETYGLVLVEALAAGLPVLASDLGGSRWLVGGAAGQFLPSGDIGAWAAGLRACLNNADADRRGAAGRRRWEAHFRASAGLPALEHAYNLARAWRAATA